MLDALEENRAPSGAVILKQGFPNVSHLLPVSRGRCLERADPGGRKEVVTTLHAPAIFGTATFFRTTPSTISIRATTDVRMLTLDYPAHERLRRTNPRDSEALAMAVVRVLCERFDLLDQRVSDLLAQHANDQPTVTEWSNFRARLFEEPNL